MAIQTIHKTNGDQLLILGSHSSGKSSSSVSVCCYTNENSWLYFEGSAHMLVYDAFEKKEEEKRNRV